MNTPKPSWKEQQRALSKRAGMCLIHDIDDRKPGKVLKFTRGVYKVQDDGALKFLCTNAQWEAARKKAEEEQAAKVLAAGEPEQPVPAAAKMSATKTNTQTQNRK